MSESVLNEIQLLLSMYDRSQIRFDDPDLEALIESSESELTPADIKSSISLTCKLNENLEIDLRIPTGYPENERLSAYCKFKKHSSSINFNKVISVTQLKKNEAILNQELMDFIKNSDPDCCDLLTVINFCNDKWELLENDVTEEPEGKLAAEDTEIICRIWIHSHHIYNKNKRKFLVDTAAELNLSGFSLPGKPGFVCVEGCEDDCDEYWTRVRQLCWQKISLIEKQIITDRAFTTKYFQELQCTKSDFIKYLDEKNLSTLIKDYLGF